MTPTLTCPYPCPARRRHRLACDRVVLYEIRLTSVGAQAHGRMRQPRQALAGGQNALADQHLQRGRDRVPERDDRGVPDPPEFLGQPRLEVALQQLTPHERGRGAVVVLPAAVLACGPLPPDLSGLPHPAPLQRTLCGDSGDAKTENGAAPVQAGQRVRRFAPSTQTPCPARGPSSDTAEPVFGYLDKAVASCTRAGYSPGQLAPPT